MWDQYYDWMISDLIDLIIVFIVMGAFFSYILILNDFLNKNQLCELLRNIYNLHQSGSDIIYIYLILN